ncbi:DNA-binding protein [Streptomyces sp. NPDC049879]|uniref:DNA-binding protein n=1 Tax=Streptomyces sp. NPDC049879 TaxID=3365598 RepID=UPI0037BCC827
MIPRGRPSTTESELAANKGFTLANWRKSREGTLIRDTLTPVHDSQTGGNRVIVYDLAQVRACLAGESIPDVPLPPHPDDLLTADEAAAILGIHPKTLRAYAGRGQADQGQERHGRRWWSRRVIEERRDNPPSANPKPSGRPRGTKDSKPRAASPAEQRAREVAELLRGPVPVTVASVMTAYSLPQRTAQRTLHRAREIHANA